MYKENNHYLAGQKLTLVLILVRDEMKFPEFILVWIII